MSSNSPRVSGTDSEGKHVGVDDLNVVMELLADHRRRYILYSLRSSDRPLDPEGLAEQIIDLDERAAENSEEEVITELHHKHLPKMEAAGVIEREGDSIRFDGSETLIDSYLDLAAELEPDVSFR